MTEGFTVTDGYVEYEHKKPPAEYHSVTPKVRLNFTVAEGADPQRVTSRVMNMAWDVVEEALNGKVDVGADLIEGMENAVKHARRGRPPKTTTSFPPADPAAIEVEPEVGNVEPEVGNEVTPLTLKGDIQPLAQKVSAHLAKVDGNINKLRAVIKDCGGNSLLTIPQDQWPLFMVEAKKLLP